MARSELIKSDKKKEQKFTENPDEIFDGARKKVDTTKDKYRSFKIQNEVYDRFVKAAEAKEIRYAGELIHLVLKKWLDEYEAEKTSVKK